MSLAAPADVGALLAAHGGFEILQTFTREFSTWLLEPARRAAEGALRGAAAESEAGRREDVQRWMVAMVSDLDVTAIITELAGPAGGQLHPNGPRYVTAAYVHAARKCFPESPGGIQHRHTIVVGIGLRGPAG